MELSPTRDGTRRTRRPSVGSVFPLLISLATSAVQFLPVPLLAVLIGIAGLQLGYWGGRAAAPALAPRAAAANQVTPGGFESPSADPEQSEGPAPRFAPSELPRPLAEPLGDPLNTWGEPASPQPLPAAPVEPILPARPRPAPPAERIARMRVTAYCACPLCCGASADGITACGLPVSADRGRFVAADLGRLPVGTRVIVPGYAGGRAVRVLDTGSAIRGNRLDVYFTDHAAAKAWGVRWLNVRVLAAPRG